MSASAVIVALDHANHAEATRHAEHLDQAHGRVQLDHCDSEPLR